MSATISELLKNRVVQIALAIVAVIAAGSLSYYLVESRAPALAYVPAQVGTVSQTVTATGAVSPIQNPTLTFTTGGRITYVRATVGQKVAAGTVLSSLDTGVLSAERAAAQAALDKLVAGPRAVDVAGKLTAVSSAQTAQDASQAAYPAAINSARSTAEAAIASTDPLFTDPNTRPQLQSMYERISDRRTAINDEREALNSTLTKLDKSAAGTGDTDMDLDGKADQTLDVLSDTDTYLSNLSSALNDARTDNDLSASTIGSALTSVNASRESVDAAIRALTQAQQQNASTQLAVESAQNDLALAQAPARAEDVQAAQAQVASIDAQIRQAEVVAPFAGVIASVDVKQGDVIAPNTDAISLIPNGTSEVDVYLTEQQVAMLQVGDQADVTLDAFGSGRVFPASVATVDRAPSTPPGGGMQGYKVTLVFADADPSIGIGMHANATIHGRTVSDVLTVPRTSIITDGTNAYVLKKGGEGVAKTPVTVGLMGTDTAQITSGLAQGDLIARVGSSD